MNLATALPWVQSMIRNYLSERDIARLPATGIQWHVGIILRNRMTNMIIMNIMYRQHLEEERGTSCSD